MDNLFVADRSRSWYEGTSGSLVTLLCQTETYATGIPACSRTKKRHLFAEPL